MNFFSLNLSSQRTQRDTFLNQIAVCSAVSIIFWKLISSCLLLVFCSFSRLTDTRVSKIITETLNPPSKRSKQLQNVIIYDKCLMVTRHFNRGEFGMISIDFCKKKSLTIKWRPWKLQKIRFLPLKRPPSDDFMYRLEQAINHLSQLTQNSPVSFRKIFSIFSFFCWKIVRIFRMAAARKIK